MAYDVIVVGGGPAGLSAAQNVRARGKTVLVVSNPLEENPLWRAKRVENYLGLPGVSAASGGRQQQHSQQQRSQSSHMCITSLGRSQPLGFPSPVYHAFSAKQVKSSYQTGDKW